MMRLMVTLSLLMNVAVLRPVCAGLLTDAPTCEWQKDLQREVTC